jgi:hypothetical protein
MKGIPFTGTQYRATTNILTTYSMYNTDNKNDDQTSCYYGIVNIDEHQHKIIIRIVMIREGHTSLLCHTCKVFGHHNASLYKILNKNRGDQTDVRKSANKR